MFRLIHTMRILFAVGWSAALLAMLPLAGVDSMALQTAGWATMTLDFVAESGLTDGLKRTFSGEEPCGFCNVAMQQQKRENEPLASVSLEKQVATCGVRRGFPSPVNRSLLAVINESSVLFLSSLSTLDPPPPRWV